MNLTEELIRDSAWCSLVSTKLYDETEDDLEHWIHLQGGRTVRHIDCDATDTQGVIFIRNGHCYVIFRGSESDQDILTDASVALVEAEGPGRVHEGFDLAWSSVAAEVLDYVYSQELPVVFSGHSLGGAVAIRAAEKVNNLVSTVITFGSPAVGDEDWADEYNRKIGHKTLRWVLNNDLVARLPPAFSSKWLRWLPCFRYRQVGIEAYLPARNGGIWISFPGARGSRVGKFFDGLYGRLLHVGSKGLDSLKDHGIGAYWERIGRLVYGKSRTLRVHDRHPR